jgi:hypothetical protein
MRAHVPEHAAVRGADLGIAQRAEPLVQVVLHLALDVLQEGDEGVLRALCHVSQDS